MGYTTADKDRALRLLGQGLSPHEVSIRMGGKPCANTVRNWAMRYQPELWKEHMAAERKAPAEPASYPLPVKLRAIRQLKAGWPAEEVALALGTERSTVYRWLHVEQERGIGALITPADMDLALVQRVLGDQASAPTTWGLGA